MVDEKSEEKTTEQEKESSESDPSGRDKSGEDNPVIMANQAAERLERANQEKRELLKREEEMEARRILGGRSKGAEQVKQPEEEDPVEYSKRALAGNIKPKEQ